MSDCCGEIIYKGLCKRGRPVEVMDCAVCGFKHLHPKPSAAELDEYYKSQYFTTEKPDYAKTSGTESEYQFLVDEEKIKAALGSQPNTLGLPLGVLDYGCGPRAPFLRHLAHLSDGPAFKAYGMEPTQQSNTVGVILRMAPAGSADENSGATIANSMENLVKHRKECLYSPVFDIIHLGFVLEHVASPMATLLEVKKHLAPGGRVIVEVPNDFNPLQMHLWKSGAPWWVSSPDHVSYFDFNSLMNVAYRAGLHVHVAGTTYPVELFIAHGQDFRTNPAAGKLVTELRADLQRLWRHVEGDPLRNKIGRTVWAVLEERS